MLSHLIRKLTPYGPPVLPRLERFKDAAGWCWQLAPGAEETLGSEGPEFGRWVADGRVQLVKENPARSVYRVTLPAGVVYVKRCRAWNLRAWGREVLRPAKAKLEFDNALRLAARGIAAVAPLGWACRRPGWPGESILLTREVPSAVPFVQMLESDLPTWPELRRTVAIELGRFLAQMHEAGVAHPDPHPGNFLVAFEDGEPRFTLIDVHDVRLGPPLSWRETRANLVLFNRWFQLRADRSDRQRFWQAYVAGRSTGFKHSEARRQIEEVEARTLASNLRFWSGRATRCLGSGRHFRIVRSGSVRGVAVRDLPDEFVQPLLADPDALFTQPGVKLLKESPTSTVAEWHVGSRVLILKRFSLRHRWEWWKNLVRRSAAIRSWVMGHSFRDRWLPTPRPLVVLHRVTSGLQREGYLLTEKVPDALTLPEATARLMSLPLRERREIASVWSFRLAKLIHMLHGRGGSHRDLKASNLLLQGATNDLASATPVFIDLVGARTRRPIGAKRRARELARINASFLQTLLVSRTDRLRFLRTYLLANLGKAGSWKWWWKEIEARTSAKVAKNAKSGRPLA